MVFVEAQRYKFQAFGGHELGKTNKSVSAFMKTADCFLQESAGCFTKHSAPPASVSICKVAGTETGDNPLKAAMEQPSIDTAGGQR